MRTTSFNFTYLDILRNQIFAELEFHKKAKISLDMWLYIYIYRTDKYLEKRKKLYHKSKNVLLHKVKGNACRCVNETPHIFHSNLASNSKF